MRFATQIRAARAPPRIREQRAAGIEFTNGDQPGVRLTKAAAAHSTKAASASNPTAAAKTVRGKTARATEKKG